MPVADQKDDRTPALNASPSATGFTTRASEYGEKRYESYHVRIER